MPTVSYYIEPKRHRLTRVLAGELSAISRKVSLMAARYRQRRQLLQLGVDQLEDIGLSREQALNEASKPFWK